MNPRDAAPIASSTLASLAASLVGVYGPPAAAAAVGLAILTVNLQAWLGNLSRRPYYTVAVTSALYSIVAAAGYSGPLERSLASLLLLATLALGFPASGGRSEAVAFAVLGGVLSSFFLDVREYGYVAALPLAEYYYAYSSHEKLYWRLVSGAAIVASPLIPGHGAVYILYGIIAYSLKSAFAGTSIAGLAVASDIYIRPFLVAGVAHGGL